MTVAPIATFWFTVIAMELADVVLPFAEPRFPRYVIGGPPDNQPE